MKLPEVLGKNLITKLCIGYGILCLILVLVFYKSSRSIAGNIIMVAPAIIAGIAFVLYMIVSISKPLITQRQKTEKITNVLGMILLIALSACAIGTLVFVGVLMVITWFK